MVPEFCALKNTILLLQESGGLEENNSQETSLDNAQSLTCNIGKDDGSSSSIHTIRKKSEKNPSLQTNSSIWAFLIQTSHNIKKSKLIKPIDANLSPAQIIALEH